MYLDCKGLLALWREGLLARKVLYNSTIGYRKHPQLVRFRNAFDPILAINAFLSHVYIESQNRCYNFDKGKIDFNPAISILPVTRGQMKYELDHLLSKLANRDLTKHEFLQKQNKEIIIQNPVFYTINGSIESWEKCRL